MVVAEAELARRAEHAFGDDAADLAPLDLEVAGQRRADRRERHDHARLRCSGAPHTTRGRAVAEVDVGEPDAVGVGVRHDVEDPRHDDAVDLAARLVDRLDFEAELVERVGDRRRGRASTGVNSRIQESGTRIVGPQNWREEADVAVQERS